MKANEDVTGRSLAIGTLRPGESRMVVWYPHEEFSTFLKIANLGGKPVSANVIPYPEGECATVSVTIQPNLEIKPEMKQVNDLWCWKWE